MNEYPIELRRRPVPVVMLQGCEEIHSVIAQHVSKVQSEEKLNEEIESFRFISAKSGESPPPRRTERRHTYDGYIPQGILRADWMFKHVNLYPSVWIVMYDVSKEKQWRSLEQEIIGSIEHARSFRSRNIRMCVVFVTQDSNHAYFEEKVSVVRKKVELSEKHFLHFAIDDPIQSVRRLQQLMIDLSYQYYRDEGKQLKRQRDFINRRTHPQLAVRNSFKVAFLAEFRADARTAVKYYSAAYNSLREVPKNPSNVSEVKVVADFINFKICKLFLVNTRSELGLSECISQFQKHMKNYKPLVGVAQRQSEHCAWLSRQYQVAGELLEVFVGKERLGSAPGYRHPGYYYHAAASYAIERKTHALRNFQGLADNIREACKDLLPFSWGAVDRDVQRYIGQRPLDVENRDGIDPLRDPTEAEANEALQRLTVREGNAPHSRTIIRLLTKAYEQYESQKSSRMILFLASCMAEEYFAAGKYERSMTFYNRISKSYRKERWWALMVQILSAASACARHLELSQSYLEYVLELSLPFMPVRNGQKESFQRAMLRVIGGDFSVPPSFATGSLPPLQQPLAVDISNLVASSGLDADAAALIVVVGRFESAQCHALEEFCFTLSLTSRFTLPVRFQRLQVEFSDQEYNCELKDLALPMETDCKIGSYDRDNDGLLLLPNQRRVFRFPHFAKAPCHLQCTTVALELGLRPNCVRFHQRFVRDATPPKIGLQSHAEKSLTFLQIVKPKAGMKIDVFHHGPALVSELYRFDVILSTEETVDSGVLFLAVENTQFDQSDCFYRTSQVLPVDSKKGVNFEMKGQKEWRETFYVTSMTSLSKRFISIRVDYTPQDSGASHSSAVGTSVATRFSSPVILPVTARCAFFSSHFSSSVDAQGGASIVADEPCLVRVEVQSQCPFPIRIMRGDLELNDKGVHCGSTHHGDSGPIVMEFGDKHTSWFAMTPTVAGAAVGLGVFKLQWTRFSPSNVLPGIDADNERVVVTPTLIPPVKVRREPFSASVTHPNRVTVGCAFTLSTLVRSNSGRVEDLTLLLKDSENFLVAGTKSTTFKITPSGEYHFKHTLVPTNTGKLQLPNLQIVSKRLNKELYATKQKRFVFVSPVDVEAEH